MKILITGGTGLIGRFLIPRLQELDHSITVVTRDPAKAQQTLGDTVALLPVWTISLTSMISTPSSIWRANRLPKSAGAMSKNSACVKAAGK